MLRTLWLGLALLTLVCLPQVGKAQSYGSASGTSSSGLFGSRSLGQGVGSSGSNFQGSPGNMVQQAQAGAGQASGNERFVRDSRAAGAFVGADSGDASAFFSQMQGGANTRSGLEEFARAAAQRQFQNQNNGGSSRTQLRSRLTLGFAAPSPADHGVSAKLSKRITKLPGLQLEGPLSIAMEGRTAILRGQVASDYDRQMIGRIALLEPGVAAVQNDLTVLGVSTPAKSLPEDPFEAPPVAPRAPQPD